MDRSPVASPCPTLEFALAYLSNDWSIIPLSARVKIPPKGWSWKPYQSTRATEDELTAWFADDTANLGIVTGALSDLTVLDCDSDDAIALAERLGLPPTWTVQTGKGRHYYFRYQHGSRNFQKRDDLPGIDLRSEGGYVCFTAGHRVIRKSPWKPNVGTRLRDIESIVAGDILMAYDEETGRIVETTVRETLRRTVMDTVVIKFGARQGFLRLTNEHPLYTTQGWRTAGELRKGDELFHVGSSQVGLQVASYHAPKGTQPRRGGCGTTRPYKQLVQSHRHGMTGYEEFLASLAHEQGIDLEFVGDGRLVIASGGFYLHPDFIIPGTNKIVEVSVSWHKKGLSGAPRTTLSTMPTAARLNLLRLAGYDPLFIDATEWGTGYTKDSLALLGRLRKTLVEFAGNGLRVDFVQQMREEVEVHNLHCEPFNNYFVRRIGKGGEFILAHNCGPPSIHPNGSLYQWLVNTGSLAELPAWVVASQPQHKTPFPLLYGAQPPGARNMSLTRLAGKWVKIGLEDAMYIAQLWNAQQTPALPWREVARTIQSVWDAEQRRQRTVQTPYEGFTV